MKILLIHPRENIWIRSKTVPLGLGYIASVLEKAGHNVKIIDYRIFPDRELEKADVVGITATTPLIRGAWEIAREAKKKFNAITVLGGPHVSALPEESAKLPYIDYVVRGEGEDTIVQLCSILEQGKSAEQVLGVSFKKDNKIIHHPHREFIKNIDDIPFPAYHLFPPLDKYTNPQPLISERTPAANIMTSRGCPFDCVFCYKGVYGRHYRVRSPENLIAEWKWLIETYNVKEIAIQDDMFNIKLDRAKNICKLIIKENLAIPWSTPNGIRADFFDEELAVLMKEAGCYRIAFGIESGNQDILNSI
ncbi:MAG: B12-binding domain-containing radical SAM protein, partial [Nitrospirae bacterium]|nr:B12-binding domain-containing radical SAM protein [Nitrospirota bacterium]